MDMSESAEIFVNEIIGITMALAFWRGLTATLTCCSKIILLLVKFVGNSVNN